MKLERLTCDNAKYYVGFEIIFQTRGKNHIKKILNVSKTGKTITVDCPDLKNTLVLTRKIHVIIPE
jgi:hypothetical protein